MKKKLVVAFALAAVLAATATSNADRYTRAHGDNPMRILGYVLNPVGLALEYVVMRPIHWVVSQPDMDIVFGHKSAPEQEGTYFEWTHGDFAPSIGEERDDRARAAKPVTKSAASPAAKAPESKAMKAPASKAGKKEMKKEMKKEAPKGADTEAKAGCCSEKKS
ncbi:hypothetical protein IT570_03640 [Candidatus Sumerlaeota bacterium]|nr:hypothetical protein [Candidatus Sumerlaeota bacterium]